MMGHGHGSRGGGQQKAKDFKGTLLRLSKYLKPYRIGLVIVVLTAIMSVIFSIVSPKVMAKITNELFRPIMELMGGIKNPTPINFDYLGYCGVVASSASSRNLVYRPVQPTLTVSVEP